MEFQSIPTNFGNDWEAVTITDDTYLIVANNYDGSSRVIDSRVYLWDGMSFVEVQQIPTSGAQDWESFTIGGEVYLAVANFQNNVSTNINSKIYRWNGTGFAEVQWIPTLGATSWKALAIGTDLYLAVANYSNGTTNNVDSTIYKAVFEIGAGNFNMLNGNAYFQLDQSQGLPPSADCDAPDEIGQMKVDSQSTNLYVCTASGWVIK